MRLGGAWGSGSPALVAVAVGATLLSAVGVAALGDLQPAGGTQAVVAATGPAGAEPPAAEPAEAAAAGAPAPLPLPEGALPDAALAGAPLPDAPPPAAPAPAGPPAAPAPAPALELRSPDLLVTLPAPLTAEQVSALGALPEVVGVTVADLGTVQLAGQDARLLGVDPATFRAFTPQETARSDALWEAVSRGEVAPTFGLARDRQLTLGGPVSLGGSIAGAPVELPVRIGAVAAFGLPGVDVVLDRARARQLGVVPQNAVLISAPARGISALRTSVTEVLGAEAAIEVLRPEVARARAGKPRNYRELYIDSARYCKGLSWTVLAAIGQVESGHGRHLGPSSAGALGPMQFLPSTWAAYGIDGDKDGRADIMNPFDAVPSSAAYLCRFGANRGPQGLYDAIFAYNHADWYVQKVLAISAQYR